jgi:sterol desaturase/sphingolipid hydroxylase (fatty acid hydroxylase superfamily)
MNYLEKLEQFVDLKSMVAIAVIFIPLERLFPLRRSQAILRRGWKNDLVFLLLNSALMNLAVAVIAAGVLLLKPHILAPALSQAIQQPVWMQVVELVLLIDLMHYAMHRIFHAVPVLWRFHALHHSVEELDWLATFRVHPVDHIPTSVAMLLPILLLGWSPLAVAIWGAVYRWHAFFQHANVRLPLGRLGLAVVGPEFHRWHHSTAAEARDKNFAAQFALWDVIFGTCYLPPGISSQEYGIEEAFPATYVDQLCHPFRELSRRSV